MSRLSGPWRGISRTPSRLPPFDRHFLRLGDQAMAGVFIPESLREALESAQTGQAVELHTGRIGWCRIILGVRLGETEIRAGVQDLLWSTLFVSPVIFLGLFTLCLSGLLAVGSGMETIPFGLVWAVACLIPVLGLMQMLTNTRRWLMWF